MQAISYSSAGPVVGTRFLVEISSPIDPVTGNQIAHVSDTGPDFIGDLDFRPVPEPSSLTLVDLGLAAILSRLHSRIR
jgi:hypothetical protein